MAETTARREKGLCYHCDEVFAPGHKCKNRQVYMLISEEDECIPEENQVKELAVIMQGEKGEELHIKDDCGVSIHALLGTHGVHTIKLQGQVHNSFISLLLDSGSTHNFVAQALVKKHQLKTEPCTPFKVIVANGETIQCDKMISNFEWSMTQGQFKTSMYVIPLGGYDAVLGIQWMKTVSPIILHFEGRNVVIHWKGKRVILGDKGDSKQFFSVQVEDK